VNLAVIVLLFSVGLLLIVKGGDWFLDGAVWIAETSGIPHFIVGATVVSVATTLPELTVSITGVLRGEIDLAVGNAVGSVTANLGLILGISVLCIPSVVDRQFAPKAILMICGAALMTILCRNGSLTLLSALLLFLIFALYLWSNLRDAGRGMAAERESRARRGRASRRMILSKLAMFFLGLAGIIGGSRLLIDYGSELALRLGVPAGVIGVTLVAVGTSLPELVTALAAIAKKETAMSIGNIVGANVIDLTLVLPVCAAVSGGRLDIGSQTTALDLPMCLGVCALAMLPPLAVGRFYRWQGFLLLGMYAAYLAVLMT